MTAKSQSQPASLRVTERNGDVVLAFAGRLDMQTAGPLWPQAAAAAQRARGRTLVVDARELEYCDGTGVALLLSLERAQRAAGGDVRIEHFPEPFEPVLRMFEKADAEPAPPPEPALGAVELVGVRSIGLARDWRSLVAFVGEIVLALPWAVRHPRRVRWRDVLFVCETAGAHAVPVVVLIGFLIGLVLGFQSAITLRDYGAEVFLGRLIGLSIVRELGPLMTAIVLAARSGSAFAAEIGTMQINEEVDALRTMGIDPVRFLILPRILAALVVTPLLTMFATLAGLLGGLVVSISTLGLPMLTYTNAVQDAVDLHDLFGGLAKTFVFGVLVAAIACIRGLQTSGGATGVGASTTRAVVSAIVLIAVADSIFSFLYYHLGI
jgi:phospholipid/cholesterol/gamma-HCH transport system permease protein